MIRVAGWKPLGLVGVFAAGMSLAAAQPSNPKPGNDLSKLLDVSQLRLEMAENNVKVNPSLKNVSDLVASLEEYLNTTCLKDLPKTLAHNGPPTDPLCVERMERLLQLNPDNPAALCLRDGISAQSCAQAYQAQQTQTWASGSTEDLPNPALKVGLSAKETEQLEQFRAALREMKTAIESTKDEKQRMQIEEDRLIMFDKALSVACRIAVVTYKPKSYSSSIENQQEYKEVRTRLKNQAAQFLEDEQRQLTSKYEDKLATASSKGQKKLYEAILKLIENPDAPAAIDAESAERIRYILPECKEFIQESANVVPALPSGTCHRDGWYSPNCISALIKWKRVKRDMSAKKTGGAPIQERPSIIGKF